MADQYVDEVIAVTGGGSSNIDWPGGPGVVLAQGTWGGITLTLKFELKSGSWHPIEDSQGTDITLTSDGMANFEMCPCRIRLRGAGGSDPSVNIRVAPSWQGWFKDADLL